MTIPESLDNIVLALDLPRVLGATRPVEGANIGVPLLIYDLVIDGKGATVEVDPPLSGTMNPGDVIRLWLVGDTTVLDSVIIVDVNAITTLRIPKGRLHPDRVNELYYDIIRGSQNIGTSTPPLTMLYNKIRPGLKDINPEVDGHSELELLLPDAIKNGVGADFVSAQVCVSYPYCRAYDIVSLKCNGELMTYRVSKDEAPEPPNPGSAIPTTVCFTVTRTYLERAQRPSNELVFSYTSTDQLGNTPDTDAVWSVSETVDEDLAGTRLPALILREKQNDPTDDPSIIDLKKLGSSPLLLIVLTSDPRFQSGDTINATYTAKIQGQPDIVMTVSGRVEADEFGQKQPCILQIPNDKVIAGSTVTSIYVLLRGGVEIGTSRTAMAQVIGEGTPVVDPTIDSVKGLPSGIEIPNNGSTIETTFVFSGEASAGQQIELRDNGVVKATVDVDAVGDWTHTLAGQTQGSHRYTVKARNGNGAESAARILTVVQPVEIVDPSRLVLSGANLFTRSTSLVLSGTDLPNTAANRPGTGGTSPYTYTSSNTAIATVDSTGTVRSQGNGTANITVRDSQNRTGSFEVVCSGVEELVVGNYYLTSGVTNYIAGQGGRGMSLPIDARMKKYRLPEGTGQHFRFLTGYEFAEGNEIWCYSYQWAPTMLYWSNQPAAPSSHQYHLGTIYLK